MTAILFTTKSSNAKTGHIPVTTSSAETCPADCPFQSQGCYAKSGPLGFLWSSATKAGPNATFQNGRNQAKTIDWSTLCNLVAELPADQLWRHNQAGDLPHTEGKIDAKALSALVEANGGKRGFTYTHHNPRINAKTIKAANVQGFTVNLSANNPAHADELADLEVGPVVTVLPSTISGKVTLSTPKGRKVVVCPGTYREDVSCETCGLCQVVDRKTIVGFPAHGARKRAASAVAQM